VENNSKAHRRYLFMLALKLDALRIRVKEAAERSPSTARSRCPPYLRRGSTPWSSEST
jgi:hypothetical protein